MDKTDGGAAKSMRSTRFWVILIGGILVAAAVLSFWLLQGQTDGTVARVYQDGVCIKAIDLSAVTEPYSFPVEWEDGGCNIISVEPGRICVSEADCPDQVCVRQGWISDSVAPIACLPHRLVIEISDSGEEDPGVDAAVG